MEKEYTYSAFISYSSKDEKIAKSLWKKLERYRLPAVLQKQYEDIPEKMHIFLDQGDIVPGDTVENALSRELADSRKLIVICSSNSAVSPYVELEVKNFLSLGHSTNDIIPYIIDGEVDKNSPNNCYVPSLFGASDKDTLNGVSVIRDGKWKAFVGVLANLLDVKFDEIYKREKVRKNRITAAWGGFGVLLACLIGLVLWYVTPHTKCYMDYITKWGIPVGINKLNKKQVKQEPEHYEIRTQFGRPQELLHADSKGLPLNQLHYMNHFDRPKFASFKYEKGFTPFVPMRDWILSSAEYTINSGNLLDGDKDYKILLEFYNDKENENIRLIDFYYGKGTRERKSLSNNFLAPSCFYYSDISDLFPIEGDDLNTPERHFFEDVSSIFQLRINYDTNGYDKSIYFYNYNNNSVCDKNEINGINNEFDELGRIKKQTLSYNNYRTENPNIIEYSYDEKGHFCGIDYLSFLNENGNKKVLIPENKNGKTTKFNANSNKENEVAVNKYVQEDNDSKSNETSGSICYYIKNTYSLFSYCKKFYEGNKYTLSFYDEKQRYVENPFAKSITLLLRKKYDSHERLIYQMNDSGIECNINYKGMNCSIEYSENGNPCKFGTYAQANFTYDNNNNLVSCDFKDEKNEYVSSAFGFSKYEAIYNIIGTPLAKKILKSDEKLSSTNSLGYSLYKTKESYSHNYLLEEGFYGVLGNLVVPKKEDYSNMLSDSSGIKRTQNYYSLGKKVREKVFENDNLQLTRYYTDLTNGVQKIIVADKYGRLIESSYLDSENHFVNQSDTEAARKTVDYKDYGQIIRFYKADNMKIPSYELVNYNDGTVDYRVFYSSGGIKSLMKNNSEGKTYYLEEYGENSEQISESNISYNEDGSFIRRTHDYKKDEDTIEYRDKNRKLINGPELYSAMSYGYDEKNIKRKVVLKADENGDLTSLSNLSGKVIMISDVFQDTPAQRFEVKEGDLIVEWSDYKYFPAGSEAELLESMEIGKTSKSTMLFYRPSDSSFYSVTFEPGSKGFGFTIQYAGNSIEESEKYINELQKNYNKWQKNKK